MADYADKRDSSEKVAPDVEALPQAQPELNELSVDGVDEVYRQKCHLSEY